ncbi:MAG: DNA polymerase/3'-5' exonuclease PolX [Rhizobiales bacterium]|nr:DNA polymerase/3'-5' exonuclease PolX [Hyphomicrobiales bacterium]MBI3672693.1 DNA polymerase/3'-5' exonuclease PolX [Hyphomicrobiales bacterium]
MAKLIHNTEIAAMFDQLADLLEIEGANRFRVRAYRNAAREIANLPRQAADMAAAGEDLAALPAIGDDLAGKIAEIAASGRLKLLDEVTRRTPAGLSEIVALPGIGPKRAKILHDKLGVKSIADLAARIKAGSLQGLAGFGARTVAKMLQEIEARSSTARRFKLHDAESQAEPLCAHLASLPGVERAIIAGSYRRRKETVGDIDILVTCAAKHAAEVTRSFTSYLEVERVAASGPTRSTVILRGGLQADLRVVPPASHGAALHYFTGSKDHNIAIRAMAVKDGLKVNEYGAFLGAKQIAGRREEDIYRLFGMDYIEPELRENGGEIEAAKSGRLPKLVTVADIRGDLHAHTSASDGTLTIAEMAEVARRKGYDYLAITDHSKRVSVAHGLDEKRLNAQIDEIDKLQERFGRFRILKSCEVDILSDGKLDITDDTLKRLDFVYGAVHYNFELPREKQTERIIRAMDNRHFSILAHPTGRIINRRPPYDIDMERIVAAARQRGCAIEINAHPDRLDMNDVHARMAKEAGVKIAIGTDAHSAEGLEMMRYGIDQARRGWLEAKDVINTRAWPELRKLLKRTP